MSKQTYSGYPGVYPNPNNQSKPAVAGQEGTVLAETADSKLIRTNEGILVITDKDGDRRSS